MGHRKVRHSNVPVVGTGQKKKRRKEGRRCRKYGRNKKWCEAYRASGRQERNRRRRILRHLKRYPADLSALAAL